MYTGGYSNGYTYLVGPIGWWGFTCSCFYVPHPLSAYADYILMEPSTAYEPIMATVHEKIYLSKVPAAALTCVF